MLKKLQRRLRHMLLGWSPNIRAYRRYRRDGMALNHKIMDAILDEAALTYVSRALGMMGRDRTLVLDDESDFSVLMDYALYEYRPQGKNAVERYREEIGGSTQIEQELLDTMVVSSPSLFKILSVSKETYIIHLGDLVNEERTVALLDINFSQGVKPDWLLFIRPVTFENWSMTSGMALLFRGDMEDELLKQWHRPQRRRKGRTRRNDQASRYEAIFKLSRRRGVRVRYE
jgi:hypothetical protein